MHAHAQTRMRTRTRTCASAHAHASSAACARPLRTQQSRRFGSAHVACLRVLEAFASRWRRLLRDPRSEPRVAIRERGDGGVAPRGWLQTER
eukprot:4092398-Pleurochrysis_carterae.AAC.1